MKGAVRRGSLGATPEAPGNPKGSDLKADGLDQSGAHAGFRFVLVFLALTIGIVALGAVYYRTYERTVRTAVEDQLSSIADLKVSQLVQWRKERMADGLLLLGNPSFSAMARRLFAKPTDADARRQLLDWLGKYPTLHGYDLVRLMDAQGVTRLSVPGDVPKPASITLRAAADVLRSGQVTLQDLYRNEDDQRIYLQVMVPVFDDLSGSRALGVVNLRVDAADYLFPFIQTWPVPTQTAETLLVRREGGEVVFLNDLRFRADAALVLHNPVGLGGNLPAASAVLGQTGIMEGVDYRGVKVLAALRGIPDSPWFLVAKLDVGEAFAPIRAHLFQVIAMIGVLLLAAGSATGLIWRQQRLRFYREQAEAAEAVRESEARFRTLFAEAPVGSAVIDSLTARILEVNPKFAQIADRSMEQMREIDWIQITHPDDVQPDLDNMALLNAGKTDGFRMEKRYIRLDGTVVWIDMTVARLNVEDKAHPRHLCMIQDITGRKQSEAELLELNATLEQRVAARSAELVIANRELARQNEEKEARTAELAAANQELEAFSYSVSHDLRTPLRSIDGFSRVLQEDYAPRLDDEARDSLARIRAAAQRMGQLIDDLLKLSRITRSELSRERVDMSTLARAVADELREQEPGRAVELVVEDGLSAQGDPRLLRVVLENLLGNAWKFTGKCQRARIEFGATAQNGRTTWFVRDNGAGFDQAHAGKMFGAFQRLHSSQEFAGTGIGLATAQRIVRRHGGRLWAEGTVGQGATFWFDLNTEGQPKRSDT